MEKGEDVNVHDPRLLFLASVVQKSLRLKADRWTKMLAFDEPRKVIQEFLDNAEPALIVFTQSGPSVLCVYNVLLNTSNHPAVFLTGGGAGTRMNSLYFLKKRSGPVHIDPNKSLLYGDISPQPLDQILTFLSEVIWIDFLGLVNCNSLLCYSLCKFMPRGSATDGSVLRAYIN